MEGLPRSPRGLLEQQWAQLDEERKTREERQMKDEAYAENERRRIEAVEARRNSDEVRKLNDYAIVEMFGTQGKELHDHDTGERLEPSVGVYGRMHEYADHISKSRPGAHEVRNRAEAYREKIQKLIEDEGFEPAQANLIDQLDTEREAADEKRRKLFFKQNIETMDKADAQRIAERQINFIHNRQGDSGEWNRALIKNFGIYTREEYDNFRKSAEFKNLLNDYKANMRFNRHDRSREEVRNDYAEKKAREDAEKARKEAEAEAKRKAEEEAERKRLEAEAKRKADEEKTKVLPPPIAPKPRTETPFTHVNYSKNPVMRWLRGVPGSRLKDKIGYMTKTLSEDVRNKRAEARKFAETDAPLGERISRYAEAGMIAASIAMAHSVEDAQSHLDNVSEQAKAEIAKREGRRARNRREAHENKGKDKYSALDSLFGKEEGEKRGYENGNDSVTPEESSKQVDQIRRMSVEDLTRGLSDEDVAKLSTPALNAYKMRRAQLPKLQRIQKEQAKKAEQQPINLGEIFRANDEVTQRVELNKLTVADLLRLSPDDVSKLQPMNAAYVQTLQRARQQADQQAAANNGGNTGQNAA